MKIRNKISLGFLAIFIAVLVLIGVSFDFYSSRVIKRDAYSYLTSSNRARAEHIRTYIKEKETTALIMGDSAVYRDLLNEPVGSGQYKISKEKVNKRLKGLLFADQDIHQALILDKKGKVIVASDILEEGVDKSQDEIFTGSQKGVHFKSVYYSEILKDFAYAVSAPILSSDGLLLGVSVLRYSASDFYQVVASENGLGDTEENFLINKENFFITPSRFLGNEVILKQKVDTQNGVNCFDPKEIDYVTKNGYGGVEKIENHSRIIQATDYRGVNITGTHAYIPETGWCLITKVDTADLLAYRYNLILFILGIFLISGLILFFFGYFLARRITWPLKLLSQFTKEIKQGNFDVRSDIKTKDEIGDLSNSFNFMVEAVHESQSNIEKKVEEQTKEIVDKQKGMAEQQKAVLNILEDIEGEKEKTELLAKDLEKFKLAVAEASDHIVITDPDGIVLFANKGVEKITGFSNKEVVGQKSGSSKLWGGLMDKAYYEKMWKTIKTDKKPFNGEINNKRKNGELYTAFASITPILNESGEVEFFVALERDITKERQIDKAKTEFVSLASHQLRTPLSAINWYTEMLLAGDAGKINPEQKKYLEEIYNGNHRMVDLVNALLNVSRLELGTFAVEPVPMDFAKEAKSVISELVVQIKEKSLKIVEEYEKGMPIINADPKLVRILFQNILTNAIKYTPEKGKITVKVAKDKKNIIITISDTGYGIPENAKDKIFTKLFRADNIRERNTDGTGLGLYMIKSIVDESGGKIWFESKENKGTTFFITLPLSGMKKKEGAKELTPA